MTHFIVKWPIFFLITESNKQLYFQHSVGYVDLGNQKIFKDNLNCKIRAVITGIKILQETLWCNRRSNNGSFFCRFCFERMYHLFLS